MLRSEGQVEPHQSDDVQITSFKSQLTNGAWSLNAGRHHAIIPLSGDGDVHVQWGTVPFSGACLIWLPAGDATKLTFSAGTRGFVLAASEVGLAHSLPVGPIGTQMHTLLADPVIQPHLDPGDAKGLEETLVKIEDELGAGRNGAQEAVRHLLALFMISVWRLSAPTEHETQPLPGTIAMHFLRAVEVRLREHWTVARYARELGVSPDRLNTTVRRTTGRPPLALIHERIVREANALLGSSTLQIAEIADQLGYADPSYFSRFYKRVTGRSPNQYRQFVFRTRAGRSYAAWP